MLRCRAPRAPPGGARLPRCSPTTPIDAGAPTTSEIKRTYAPGDWFAIPLRFGLFALGRATAADDRGAILGYFFARFFERSPRGPDVLALSPGDAEIVGACDAQRLRNGQWPIIAGGATRDPRPWTIPCFRTLDAATGRFRWSTFEPADLGREILFEAEPALAGDRNWGLPMHALDGARTSPDAVESRLFGCFRVHQNALHRRYIADLQRHLTTRAS